MYPGRQLSPVDYDWKVYASDEGRARKDPRYHRLTSISEFDLYGINGALDHMYRVPDYPVSRSA